MVAFVKDAEGNRLTRTRVSDGYVTAYEWDHRNRLVSVTELDDMETVLAVNEHDYDAFNQWIRRTVDADGPGSGDPASTIFAHHDGQIVYQFDGDAASDLTNRYLWNPAAVDHLLVDEVVANLTTAGDLQFPLGDHLGTIRDIAEYDADTDTTTIANHIRYNSFGQVISETNSAIELLFGFTSRPFDDSTSLQINLNRWYDAALGQWASEDPIGFLAGDENLRGYVSNSSLTFIDPLGLFEYTSISWTHELQGLWGYGHLQDGAQPWRIASWHFGKSFGVVNCKVVEVVSEYEHSFARKEDPWLDKLNFNIKKEDVFDAKGRHALKITWTGSAKEDFGQHLIGAGIGSGVGGVSGFILGGSGGGPLGGILGRFGGSAGGGFVGGGIGAVATYPFDHGYEYSFQKVFVVSQGDNCEIKIKVLENSVSKRDDFWDTTLVPADGMLIKHDSNSSWMATQVPFKDHFTEPLEWKSYDPVPPEWR